MTGDDPFAAAPQAPHLNVRIVNLPAVTLATMRHVGAFGPALRGFWQDRFSPWLVAQGLAGRPLYGICHDDPAIVAAADCRYDAGVEVPADFAGAAGAVRTTLPGGCYAALAFHGRPEDIGPAWTAVWRDWLPHSGWQFDPRPCFEHYAPGAGFDPATQRIRCDLCLPVEPL